MVDPLNQTTDLAELEAVARANGYWHNIKPFADEIERLRAEVARLEDNIDTITRYPCDS